MILKRNLWLVSHKEGTASPVTIERYAAFVIGCHTAGKSATEDWTLCTDEKEAAILAARHANINEIVERIYTLKDEDIRTLAFHVGLKVIA